MVKRKSRQGRGKRVLIVVLAGVVGIPLLITFPFRWLPPPTTSFMLHAATDGLAGEKACTSVTQNWVDWNQIAAVMPLAVIAAEDQKFPSHWGLDFGAISTAIKERTNDGRLRGASTITQQLVKNMYLWPGQSWLRKVLEAWLAFIVEVTWSKQRILEVYLNVVQFDACTFGVKAASRYFYQGTAASLTGWQAARLAAVLPNPVRYHVDRPTAYVEQRTMWILQQMQLLGGTQYLRSL